MAKMLIPTEESNKLKMLVCEELGINHAWVDDSSIHMQTEGVGVTISATTLKVISTKRFNEILKEAQSA